MNRDEQPPSTDGKVADEKPAAEGDVTKDEAAASDAGEEKAAEVPPASSEDE